MWLLRFIQKLKNPFTANQLDTKYFINCVLIFHVDINLVIWINTQAPLQLKN